MCHRANPHRRLRFANSLVIAKLRQWVNDRAMSDSKPGFVTLLKTRQRRECMKLRLVLDAAGIPADAIHRDRWWYLIVVDQHESIALSELDAYRQENPAPAPVAESATPRFEGAATGVFVYATVITIVFLLSVTRAYELNWYEAGTMQAGKVVDGAYQRTATALTLHVDGVHLVSNLVFGSVFGLLAGRVLGGGVAWLAILLAGSLGNLINALVQSPEHRSLGASTAVFAALGVIVSHALRPARPTQEKALRRWSPLIGGVLLLAFTGVGGERTDVAAHGTGFFAGLLIGWFGSRLPNRLLARRTVQLSSGFLAIVTLVIAWLCAFTLPS